MLQEFNAPGLQKNEAYYFTASWPDTGESLGNGLGHRVRQQYAMKVKSLWLKSWRGGG